ncbi:TolC family protein [bacterium]|nr:TolC family protein [bacterium]
MKKAKLLCMLSLVLIVTGCTWYRPEPYQARWPQPRPLSEELVNRPENIADARYGSAMPEPSLANETTSGSLTLREALVRVLQAHPDLLAIEHEVAAREAEALQAGLPPNPELDAELEDVFGGISGPEGEQQDLSGFSGAEATVMISQTIELAGKRMKRRRLAETQADVAAWDLEARRLKLITEVHATFVELLSAQRQAALAQQLVEVAERAHDTVARRVEAGKISPIEERRARVAMETQRAQLVATLEALGAVRRRLATYWGGEPAFEEGVGELDMLVDVPQPEALNELLIQNPRLARWATEMAVRRAELDLAEAGSVPDPTIGVGARYFNETENHSFLIGFSMPIPLFDRNQGNIAAARLRVEKAEAEQDAVLRSLRSELADSYGRLTTARKQLEQLRDEVIPEAQVVYESLLEGFWLGEFDLVNVLDAQQRVFELRSSYLESLTQYQQALAQLEGLLGTPLNSISAPLEASVPATEENEQ